MGPHARRLEEAERLEASVSQLRAQARPFSTQRAAAAELTARARIRDRVPQPDDEAPRAAESRGCERTSAWSCYLNERAGLCRLCPTWATQSSHPCP